MLSTIRGKSTGRYRGRNIGIALYPLELQVLPCRGRKSAMKEELGSERIILRVDTIHPYLFNRVSIELHLNLNLEALFSYVEIYTNQATVT